MTRFDYRLRGSGFWLYPMDVAVVLEFHRLAVHQVL
ncbi:MAG: hypothetical protein JWO59_2003 [Chloroflexi bacterium]|jgi:hypothetical protein|nr:hypothetical protein [Chloroflexota bacterium]